MGPQTGNLEHWQGSTLSSRFPLVFILFFLFPFCPFLWITAGGNATALHFMVEVEAGAEMFWKPWIETG